MTDRTPFDARRRAFHRQGLAASLGLGLGLSPGPGARAASAYPDHPLWFVVPQPAGGTGDFISRIVAQRLGERLGQTVVVENKAGAGGTLGALAAAKAAPDGYSLLLASPGMATFSSLYPHLNPNPATRLTGVGMMGAVPVTLLVRKDAPFKSVAELVAYARANPGKTSFGSAGQGSLSHLLGAWFVSETGIDTIHVPYSGTAPALTGLVGGQVDLYFDPAAGTELVRAGRLRPLASTGVRRSEAMPAVPTMKELGYAVQGAVWLAVMAPAGTPQAVLERLNLELNVLLREPELRQQFAARNVEPDPMSIVGFNSFFAEETRIWTKLVKDAGIKAE